MTAREHLKKIERALMGICEQSEDRPSLVLIWHAAEHALTNARALRDVLDNSREMTEKVTDADYLANRFTVKNHKARVVLDD